MVEEQLFNQPSYVEIWNYPIIIQGKSWIIQIVDVLVWTNPHPTQVFSGKLIR